MREYQRKPTVFKAAQWDGTMEGVDQIREVILASKESVEWVFMTLRSNAIVAAPTSYIELTIRDQQSKRVYMGDYVVCNMDHGTLEIVSEQRFEQFYKEAE